MTFASDLGSDCVECKRILEKNGVAEGYKAKCHTCPYGIRILNTKRVYVSNDIKSQDTHDKNGIKKAVENDKELE